MSVIAAKTALYNGIWARLEAGPIFTSATTNVGVLPGNRAKVTLRTYWAILGKIDPASFPRADLTFGNGSYNSGSDRLGYGQSVSGKRPGKTKELRQIFNLQLTHAGQDPNVNDPLDAEILEYLDLLGEGLGLVPTPFKYCVRGDIQFTTTYGFTESNGGNIDRQQTTFIFPVTIRWQGDTFPTQTV